MPIDIRCYAANTFSVGFAASTRPRLYLNESAA